MVVMNEMKSILNFEKPERLMRLKYIMMVSNQLIPYSGGVR